MQKTTKTKLIKPAYSKGIRRYALYFLLSLAALEGLALYFPILLQNVTIVAEKQFRGNGGDGSVVPLILQGLLVLGYIILIFGVRFLSEWLGAIYIDKYQANIRKKLYDKFSSLSSQQIDQIGIARVLPAIMNDPNWLKLYHRRLLNMIVYFPVAILGSIIMLFTLNWIYAVFALASIPFVAIFSILCLKRMNKFIPVSVSSFDEYFLNIKEGIKGAKDIRILGKADERSADFERYVHANRRQGLATDRGHAMSVGFHAILFTFITIAIIIYGATNLTVGETRQLVVLNTAIQYVNQLWNGSHQIFVWFLDTIPRCNYTFKRLSDFYAMPAQSPIEGLREIPVYKKNNLILTNISYKNELKNVNIAVGEGKLVSVVGGIGSGKSHIANMLIQFDQPTEGTITFNDIDITNINPSYWRKNFVSYCSNHPQFIPGTVRDNLRILSPETTDEQIMTAFRDIGANNFVKQFDNFLDYEIKEGQVLSEGYKNILNIVRTVLKPAGLYIFNQCFEHVRPTYITKLMARLKREKKTAVFITFNGAVCKASDDIYVLKKGVISGEGTHASLIKNNKDYREFHASEGNAIIYDEEISKEKAPEEVYTEAMEIVEKKEVHP